MSSLLVYGVDPKNIGYAMYLFGLIVLIVMAFAVKDFFENRKRKKKITARRAKEIIRAEDNLPEEFQNRIAGARGFVASN